MSGFATVGTAPGEALPAPGTAAVSNGMVLNAAGLWVYPPGFLLGEDDGATFSNTVTETTLLTAAITRGFPAMVAKGDEVQFEAGGTFLNNSGGTTTLTLNLYLGATQLATVALSAGASATARNWRYRARVVYTVNGGAGAGAVRALVHAYLAGTGTGFQGLSAANTYLFNAPAAITVATNADATLDLKGVLGSATSTTAACGLAVARYFPKNY